MPKVQRTFPSASAVDERTIEAECVNAGIVLEEGLQNWECSRAFNHWVVRSTNGGLALPVARTLHQAHAKDLLPLGQPRITDVGDVANFAGKIPMYHVKSPAAFKALVTAIKGPQAT